MRNKSVGSNTTQRLVIVDERRRERNGVGHAVVYSVNDGGRVQGGQLSSSIGIENAHRVHGHWG